MPELETGAMQAPFDPAKRAELATHVAELRTKLSVSNQKLMEVSESDTKPDMEAYSLEGRKNMAIESELKLRTEDLEVMDLRNPEKILENQANMTDERHLLNQFLRAKDFNHGQEMLVSDDFTGMVVDAGEVPGSGVNGKLMFLPFKNALEAEDGRITKEMIAGNASVGTGSQSNAIRTETYPGIVERLAEYGGVAKACYQFNTDNGEAITVPQIDQSDDEGEVLTSQNTDVADENIPQIGRIQMLADTLSSKRMAVSVELITDSVFDYETFVERTAARRLGRLFNRLATDGMTGTNFEGIAALAGTGVTASSPTAFTHDDIIDMTFSVDAAYREGDMESGEWGGRAMVPGSGMVGWMVSDNFIRELMKLTDGDDRPLWTVDATTGPARSIQGYSYVRNNHLDNVVANGIPALFGNMGHFWCRNIGGIYIGNFWDSNTAVAFQHHFIAFIRRNTRLVGPKNGNVADGIKKLVMGS